MKENSDDYKPTFLYLPLCLLIAAMLTAGCALPSAAFQFPLVSRVQSTTTEQLDRPHTTLQPYLERLALSDPMDSVRIIVQYDGDPDQLLIELAKIGRVVNQFSFMDAIVAEMPAAELLALADHDAVRWISLDAPVRAASAIDGSGGNVRDDFNEIAYNGSTGALPWSSDWAEIGEADGPSAGNVAVTSFWGGALQGLRLQGATMGAMRTLTLDGAKEAQLGFAFRRKDFGPGDLVAIAISQDGGGSWQEIAHITGATTDTEIQYANYTLPTLWTEDLTIRIATAATQSGAAKFYLDAIDVRLPLHTVMATYSHQLYLPFVTDQGVTEPARTKAAELAMIGSQRGSCSYHCFDLDDLESPYIEAIGADRLWNVAPYPRGWQIGVAVVDSGISSHPDLNDYDGNSRLVKQINFVPGNPVPDDFYGHGTHVAGTIGGIGVSSDGAYMGVAPEAKLIDVRVTDDYGMGNISNVVKGIEWIYQNRNTYNIKIANLSLNSTVPESYHLSPLNAALEILWFNKIVVVVSAGNSGQEKLYPPANDPFVITVGSMDDKKTADISDDKLSSFSAYGVTIDGFLKPDIVAPGQDIVSLLASDDMNLKKSYPKNAVSGHKNKYFRMSGTSMASAVVAGAVAILLEADSNLTPDQVKYRLMATAKPVAVNKATCATGAGYLDIYAAVHANTTESANVGLTASQMLWTGANPATWSSASWNSVSWNSVSWNSVSWNSVSWNSVSWNSVSWNSGDNGSGNGNGNSNVNCTASTTDVTLVNYDTNQDIQLLYNGAVIALNAIGTTNLAFRTDTTTAVDSVRFTLSGDRDVTKVQNQLPYRLVDSANGPYQPGSYALTIELYSGSNATGTLLGYRTIHFTIVNEGGGSGNQTPTNIKLVNAVANQEIQSMYDGIIVDLSTIGTNYLTISAPDRDGVKSARLRLTSANSNVSKVENQAPYTLRGDSNGNYGGYYFSPGPYTITIDFYAKGNAKGTLVDSQTLHFTVVN